MTMPMPSIGLNSAWGLGILKKKLKTKSLPEYSPLPQGRERRLVQLTKAYLNTVLCPKEGNAV